MIVATSPPFRSLVSDVDRRLKYFKKGQFSVSVTERRKGVELKLGRAETSVNRIDQPINIYS